MIFIENINRFKTYHKKIFSNKVKFNYKVNFGSPNANNFFIQNLKKSKFFFEYGTGASTLLADKLKKKYLSVELDKTFYNQIKKKIKEKDNIKFVNIGPVGEFSYPLFKFKKKIKNYVEMINLCLDESNFPDLVLIDGRFRVACCLNLLKFEKIKKKKSTIIIDDYFDRKEYFILRDFFEIRKIGRFGILKPKVFNRNKIEKFLKKFYSISR